MLGISLWAHGAMATRRLRSDPFFLYNQRKKVSTPRKKGTLFPLGKGPHLLKANEGLLLLGEPQPFLKDLVSLETGPFLPLGKTRKG
jgi:hypothetical protein